MVNWCYLCNRKASKVDNISLHKFPKNLDTRTKWLNACGLTANDDVKTTCICSRHFVTEDVCQSKIFGSVKSFIKRKAVPKLFLTNPLNIEKSNELPSKNSIESQMPNNSKDVVGPDENDDSNQCIKNRMTDSSSEVPDGNNISSQCKKRKFYEPRYVREISTLDFATPKKANRTMQLIKKTDENKSKKIKQLQRQARDLQKRVKSFQDLINQLKKNCTLTDESGNTLWQSKDMLKRRKRKVVSVDSNVNPENNQKLIGLEHSYCVSEEACKKCKKKLTEARKEIILLKQNLLNENEKVNDLTQLVENLKKSNNNLSNS